MYLWSPRTKHNHVNMKTERIRTRSFHVIPKIKASGQLVK